MQQWSNKLHTRMVLMFKVKDRESLDLCASEYSEYHCVDTFVEISVVWKHANACRLNLWFEDRHFYRSHPKNEGGTPSQVWRGGYPIPGLGGGYLIPGLDGGYPI